MQDPQQNPEQNPYQPPSSDVIMHQTKDAELGEIRSLPAGSGWDWLARGFDLFKANAGLWIGMSVIYIVIMLLISILPVISLLATLLSPVFSGGFMIACRNADRTNNMALGDLFAGFQQKGSPLIVLGLISMGFYVLLFGVMMIFGGSALIMGGGLESGQDPVAAMSGLGAAVLVGLVLMIPLIMAQWFSPALVALHNVAPWTAFKTSFNACMKNVMPFLVYGVIAFVAAIIASIPLGLGWLILMPVLIGSIYAGYKDVFQVN
jgi:uncharacterized membrane protein